MPGPDDDYPQIFQDEPTHKEELAPSDMSAKHTRSYKSDEFLAGREAGFKEGVAAAVAALRDELVRAKCTEEEVRHIVARVRDGAGQRG